MRKALITLLCINLLCLHAFAVMPIKKTDKDSVREKLDTIPADQTLAQAEHKPKFIDEKSNKILQTETALQNSQSNTEIIKGEKSTVKVEKPRKKNSFFKLNERKKGNGTFGIISFLTGIMGFGFLFLAPILVPILLWVTAIVTGAIGFNKKNKGLAIAGLGLGILGLLLTLLILIIVASIVRAI